MDSIMIIGSAGSVGHDMMYQIASMGLPIKVIGSDVNEVKGRFEIEESLHIAHSFGFYPDLSFEKVDLFDIDSTTEKLEVLQPKVICNLASLGSWWITRLLPDDEYLMDYDIRGNLISVQNNNSRIEYAYEHLSNSDVIHNP